MKNLINTYSEFLNESTSLNSLGISQKAIKNVSKSKIIKSHKIVFAPFAGTKKDVKNELVKGKSIVAKKDPNNFIIIHNRRGYSPKQYRVTFIENGEVEMYNDYSLTKALGFITKAYVDYFTFDGFENRDPSAGAKELGRGSNNEESDYYFISELAKEKYVHSYIVKILEEQLKDLRTKVSKWVLNYDGTTKFQVETPIGTTDWESTATYRIGEISKLIRAIKGKDEFGGKSGEELVMEFIERFIDVTEYDKVDGREKEKQAAKKALAELGKNLHWAKIGKGYGYYGGIFMDDKQAAKDLK